MKKRKISDAVVRRLPRYYRYLDDLHSKGIVRISSSLLGERMGITASQIRQDLSCFGEFGQQGYGYNILELRTEIGHILGVDEQHRLVVVGAGHLGHALLRNFDFMQTGFLLDTAFDVSPALIGTRVNNVLAICVHTIKCHAFFLGTKSSLEEPSEENTVLPLPYVKRILQKK